MNNWEEYHTLWRDRDEMPSNPRIIKAISSLGEVKGKKILEIGSGMGRDSIHLARLGADVTLLDSNGLALDQAKALAEKYGVEITTVHQDLFAWGEDEEKYDIVFSQGLLEHFMFPLEVLLRKKMLCKKGGYIIADTPQTFHLHTLFKKILLLFGKWPPGAEHQFTINELENFFKIIHIPAIQSYGDWSHPYYLKKIFYRLFLGGKKIPKKEYVDNWLYKWMRTKRFSLYTMQHILVVGRNIQED